MKICARCKKNIQDGACVRYSDGITAPDTFNLCDECAAKFNMFLNTTDYEYVRNILTRVGYEKDIEAHDDKNYFVLSTYGSRVAVEFNKNGEFRKISEAE